MYLLDAWGNIILRVFRGCDASRKQLFNVQYWPIPDVLPVLTLYCGKDKIKSIKAGKSFVASQEDCRNKSASSCVGETPYMILI